MNPHHSSRLGAMAFLIVVQFFYAWAWNTSDVLRPAFRAALTAQSLLPLAEGLPHGVLRDAEG